MIEFENNNISQDETYIEWFDTLANGDYLITFNYSRDGKWRAIYYSAKNEDNNITSPSGTYQHGAIKKMTRDEFYSYVGDDKVIKGLKVHFLKGVVK